MHNQEGAALLGNLEIESVTGGDMGRARGQKPGGIPPPEVGMQGRGGAVGKLALSSHHIPGGSVLWWRCGRLGR